jgi:hypothetical protein
MITSARQFLFVGKDVSHFSNWKRCETAKGVIYHQPDLSVCQLRAPNLTISLIGYAIDPFEPTRTDAMIVGRLAVKAASSLEELLLSAAALAGRWALLVESDRYEVMLHDPCGLRQIFYSDTRHAVSFCASQAVTAAKVFALRFDPAAIEGLSRVQPSRDNEYWWPGDSTQFEGVKCLLPNHFLDLRTRIPQRFSSVGPGRRSVSDAAREAADLLKRLIDGAASRYSLALPLTAGWDSRSLLAACKSSDARPHCYTLRMPGMLETHQDIRIAKALASRLGRSHQVIDCSQEPSREFLDLYRASVDPAHDEAAAMAYALARTYPIGSVSISGHASEIARCFYHPTPRYAPIDAADLAELTNMQSTEFVLREFGKWLHDARPAARQTGIDVLDLFYWEQRVGRWAANGQAQWDCIHERFTPFSCRPLLYLLLSVEPKFRRYDYYLYTKMIQNLAPEVLAEPINPDALSTSTIGRIRKALVRRTSQLFRKLSQPNRI